MTSVVDICNMALSSLRAGTITSIDEASTAARECKQWYDVLRDQVLEDAPWGFANRVNPLALLDHSTYGIFNWVYSYQYPSDCIRINRLVRNFEQNVAPQSGMSYRYVDRGLPSRVAMQPVEYKIFDVDGNVVIASNESDLRADYTYSVTNPNVFSSSFKIALSQLLGSHIAVGVAGHDKGSAMQRDLLSLYRSYINNAVANELNQNFEAQAESESITIRG